MDLRKLLSRGPRAIVAAAWRRVKPPRAKCGRLLPSLLAGKRGLEIAGPSLFFRANGLFPVYAHVGSLDNVNYSAQTIWQGEVKAGEYRFDPARPAGRQWISDASQLEAVADASYDFVCNCHVLEHLADPLRALREWQRVLVPAGVLVLALPRHSATFDHLRPMTTLQHLIADNEAARTEDDATHFDEIIRLHDLSREMVAITPHEFRERILRNAEFRSAHHHVFDQALTAQMLQHVGFELLVVEDVFPDSVVALARKAG